MNKSVIKVIGVLGISALLMGAAGPVTCTSEQQDDAFDIACQSIPTADALFQVYVATGKVSDKVINDERLAVQAAQAACNGPRPKDPKTAAAYVQRIATAILNAVAAARKQAS